MHTGLLLLGSLLAFASQNPQAVALSGLDEMDKAIKAVQEKFKDTAFEGPQKSVESKIADSFDTVYDPVFNEAFTQAIEIEARLPGQSEIARRSATWALNLKGFSREVIGRRNQSIGRKQNYKLEIPPYTKVEEVQKHLPTNSVLFEFVRFKHTQQKKDFYAVWIIPSITRKAVGGKPPPSDAPIQLLSLGDAKTIDEHVSELHKHVSTAETKELLCLEDLGRVRHDLLEKVASSLLEEREWWIFSPAADLWLIPFGAMPMPKDLQELLDPVKHKAYKGAWYAIEEHKISYLLSGRELSILADVQPTNYKGPLVPLLIGDPEFDFRATREVDAPQREAMSVDDSRLIQRLACALPPDLHSANSATSIRHASLSASEVWFSATDDIPNSTSQANTFESVCCLHRWRFLPWRIAPPCVPPAAVPPQRSKKGHLVVQEFKEMNLIAPSRTLSLPFTQSVGLSRIVDKVKNTLNVPEQDIWSKQEATEANVNTILGISRPAGVYPLVIFATHGFYFQPIGGHPNLVQRPNPLMRCGLALAGANTHLNSQLPTDIVAEDVDDGILTGQEIVSRLDLEGTDIVMLIACETGKGDKTIVGDSLATVRQAFQIAGARLVLATSWKIADPGPDPKDHTLAIVANMCAALKKTNARDLPSVEDMLRQAQLQALRRDFDPKTNSGRAHPYFWAAFSVTGYAR